MGDYFGHWLEMGRRLGAQAPRIFFVNWFRKDGDGKYLWPGYGDNVRVLSWMLARIDGRVEARRTEIGLLPRPEDLDLSGLSLPPGALDALLSVDRDGWRREALAIADHFTKFAPRLPGALAGQLAELKQRLGMPTSQRLGSQKG
jgi:phosphoenolpyruvate carboxykinase (GTP)